MNGSYYKNPDFMPYPNFERDESVEELPMEQSYIENILRLNKGKRVRAFVSFPDSNEWRDKVFEGIIEEAGKDHLVMSDPKTGKWSLILLIYLKKYIPIIFIVLLVIKKYL